MLKTALTKRGIATKSWWSCAAIVCYFILVVECLLAGPGVVVVAKQHHPNNNNNNNIILGGERFIQDNHHPFFLELEQEDHLNSLSSLRRGKKSKSNKASPSTVGRPIVNQHNKKNHENNPQEQRSRSLQEMTSSASSSCKQCIVIDVYFHLSAYRLDYTNSSSPWMIPHPRQEFMALREELITRSSATTKDWPVIEPGRFSTPQDIYGLIENNMKVLNDLYKETPFWFQWKNSDPAEAQIGIQNNRTFFFAGNLYMPNDFAAAYHRGDSRTLNVYLVYRICGHPIIWKESNCQTIGSGTNPSYQLDGTADGIYLSYDTLTGGGLELYSNGISLAHEVGHWLGLFHVFQSETYSEAEAEGRVQDGSNNGGTSGDRTKSNNKDDNDSNRMDPCDPINEINGDFVDDTPFLPRPSVKMYKCSRTYYEGEGETIPNSCPNLHGVDPVFNIMNYVGNEDCYNDGHAVFTPGQIERMYNQWIMYRNSTITNEDCKANDNQMLLNLTMKLEQSNTLNFEIAIYGSDASKEKPIFSLRRDMDLTLFPIQTTKDDRSITFCVPRGEYVLGITEQGREGFSKGGGFIELSVDGKLVDRVDGNFGSTECLKFDGSGNNNYNNNNNGSAALAESELRNGVESIGSDFGDRYHYDTVGIDTTVTCSASPDTFYIEPVPIQKGRFMRVVVEFANATNKGMCINDIVKMEIAIDDFTKVVYPSDDAVSSFFASKVLECRDEACVVTFDLSLLEGAYNPNNLDGLYNTTCRATVEMGFGQACDQYLQEGGIDCSPEEFSTVYSSSAEGQIVFSLPVASSSIGTYCNYFTSFLFVGVLLSALIFMP